MDEEKPEPKPPVKPAKKTEQEENDEAEADIKKAELEEMAKKQEKKKKDKDMLKAASPFDGTVYKDGKRFFVDGSEVDGVNTWIANKRPTQ